MNKKTQEKNKKNKTKIPKSSTKELWFCKSSVPKGIMSMAMMILTAKMSKNTSPMYMAITILTISLATAILMYKMTLTSWLSFVTTLTFSSGMMTLFMYTASLTSNEKMKTKKGSTTPLMMMVMASLMIPTNKMKSTKQSMKTFSSQMMMMVVGILLIITMMAISMHGHHPNQTMSTSF